MEADARYTWVGAAVLALLAGLVASIVWLKNIGGTADIDRYSIYFERQSLEGLEVGADVHLRGIKVGRVEDYALADEALNRVRVEVRIDKRAPLRTNTVAVVSRNYVTGIASIALVTRQPPGELLTTAPKGESYPVIGEGRSELDDISGRVNRLGDMAATTFDSVNDLLSPKNREAMMATVRNLRDLSGGLQQRLTALDTTLERIGVAARQVGAAGERTAATVQQLGQRLDTTLAETERTLVDARRALTEIGTASRAVQTAATSTAQRLESTVGGIDQQMDAAVSELRVSIEAASRTIDRLRDPRAVLLGPGKAQLGPGEKLP